MALPDVSLTIQDFALGLVGQNTANATVKLGIAAGGLRNVLSAGYNDPQSVKTAYGAGPITEAAIHLLGVAGGPVYLMPVTPASFSGGAAVLTLTGTGAGVVTYNPAVWRKTILRYNLGGTLGTATFQISIDNGVTYLPTIYTTAATVALDHTLSQVTMGAGTYVAGDTVTFNTDLTSSSTGTSPVATSGSSQSAPTDEFDVRVKIVLGGVLGTGQFVWSVDGGDTYSAPTLLPSANKFVVPDAGFYLNFTAATYILNDLYSASTDTAGYTTTELNTAMTALFANSTEWGHVHVQGETASAAAARGVADAVETKMQAAQVQFRYAFALTECPSFQSDSAISSAFASAAYLRTGVGVGDEELISGSTGRFYRRNAAWPISARIALVPVGEDLGFVGRGPLPAVSSLYRDEFKTQALDEARFSTLRTHIGIQGFYVTNGRIMAASGSDFTYMQFRRVMDVACKTTRSALLPYLNASLRVNTTTGQINEKDAQQIEAKINAQLSAVLVATGQASGSSVVIDRNANIISTLTLPVTVRVVPLGYAKFISVTIGFENPALANA